MENSLGLPSGVVHLVPYDAAWPALFAAERARLERAFAERGLNVTLEHTGSTAIPGLVAKPVLDILGGYTAHVDRVAIISALVDAGYVHRGEQGIPGREFFRFGMPRQYHLHLTRVGSDFWRDHRAFREYLRTHADVAQEYAALKLGLAARYPTDREAYIEGKTDFVRAVLARATGG